MPPRLEAPGEFAIFAARSFDIPLSFRASYCFSFLTLGRFPGTEASFVVVGSFLPAPSCFTHGLHTPNPALTAPPDAATMKLTPLLATAAATLALAVPAATAAPADPAGAVRADLTQLQGDITKAHDTLLADLAKIPGDVGKGPDALKTDIQAFRADRQTLVGTIQTDLQHLLADVKAARDAKADPADVKSLVQSIRTLAKGDRADVQQALQTARGAVKSLKGSAGQNH